MAWKRSMTLSDVRPVRPGPNRNPPSWCVERITTMAREIKTTHPGIRSFVFLTPEEALEKYGGGFSLVGRPFTPAPPATTPPTTPAAKPVQKKGKKSNG